MAANAGRPSNPPAGHDALVNSTARLRWASPWWRSARPVKALVWGGELPGWGRKMLLVVLRWSRPFPAAAGFIGVLFPVPARLSPDPWDEELVRVPDPPVPHSAPASPGAGAGTDADGHHDEHRARLHCS